MVGHGIQRMPGNALRDLVLVVESEPDVDLDEVDRSVRQLRAEYKALDVEDMPRKGPKKQAESRISIARNTRWVPAISSRSQYCSDEQAFQRIRREAAPQDRRKADRWTAPSWLSKPKLRRYEEQVRQKAQRQDATETQVDGELRGK